MYLSLPLNYFSRIAGKFCSTELPLFLREPTYKSYANLFQCNLEEMKDSLSSCSCMADFFTRKLKDGSRLVDSNSILVSPADGQVFNFGKAERMRVEQVKNVSYTVHELIQNSSGEEDSEEFSSGKRRRRVLANRLPNLKEKDLYYCIIYLAPGDYHRFHSPTEWTVRYSNHIPGNLYTVLPKYLPMLQNKFSAHERVALVGEWAKGFFSMISVGSTNVGSIRISFDESIVTNKPPQEYYSSHEGIFQNEYSPKGIELTRGDECGYFTFGSTIVLIFEAPKDFKFALHRGQKIKYGQPISQSLVTSNAD